MKKLVRAVVLGETEEQVARLAAGRQRREQRIAELGFSEHRTVEGPYEYMVCSTCRAWLSTDEEDLRVHREFHDRLVSTDSDSPR